MSRDYSEVGSSNSLIETHDEHELKRALALEGRLIGVNNRNLRTFETSLEVCERLLPLIPPGKIVVAEFISLDGIDEVRRLWRGGSIRRRSIWDTGTPLPETVPGRAT